MNAILFHLWARDSSGPEIVSLAQTYYIWARGIISIISESEIVISGPEIKKNCLNASKLPY